MGERKGAIWGAPEATNIRLLYAKGIKLIPPSNNELKKCKQALGLVMKRDVSQFMTHTVTLSK